MSAEHAFFTERRSEENRFQKSGSRRFEDDGNNDRKVDRRRWTNDFAFQKVGKRIRKKENVGAIRGVLFLWRQPIETAAFLARQGRRRAFSHARATTRFDEKSLRVE